VVSINLARCPTSTNQFTFVRRHESASGIILMLSNCDARMTTNVIVPLFSYLPCDERARANNVQDSECDCFLLRSSETRLQKAYPSTIVLTFCFPRVSFAYEWGILLFPLAGDRRLLNLDHHLGRDQGAYLNHGSRGTDSAKYSHAPSDLFPLRDVIT